MKGTLNLSVRPTRLAENHASVEIKVPNSEIEQALDTKSLISSASTVNNVIASVYQQEAKATKP